MSDYLTLAEALAIHDDQIERYGGLSGVRDHGILEAALYRPQTGYYANLIEEAAALWESLAQNHPFIDGNKRTAFCGDLHLSCHQRHENHRRRRIGVRFHHRALRGQRLHLRKSPRLAAGECCPPSFLDRDESSIGAATRAL